MKKNGSESFDLKRFSNLQFLTQKLFCYCRLSKRNTAVIERYFYRCINVKSFFRKHSFNFAWLEVKNKTSNNKKHKIILKFNKEVKTEVSDKIWFDNFELQEDQTGSIKLTTTQPITNKLAGWCISWWDTIKVEEPKELKSYINEMIDSFRETNL